MKKIAFFIGSMGGGGAEKVISILSNYYAERGYKTDVIVLLNNDIYYELNKSTNFIDFSGDTTSRFKRVPYWLKSIRSYVKNEKPDVIVSFVARINCLVALACIGLKTKIIVSERSDPRLDGRTKGINFLTKIFYPKVDRVVFQTNRAKGFFPKLKNGIVISNPIMVKEFADKVDETKIVSVGRLCKEKNHKMLINAFYKLYKNHKEARLEIYGDGVLKDELQLQINDLELENNVKLMGKVDDVMSRIADSCIFCLSSNYEGLSNALLEAIALGIPCISTDVAGASEYIVDGESGFIVPVGDEDAFAKRMIELYSDRKKQSRFFNMNKEISNKFKFNKIMQEWDEVILG